MRVEDRHVEKSFENQQIKVILVERRRCTCPPAMFQGIQRRPDGAGPPVETPVNAAQGVNNANLNQSRSPLPTNDPFMDTAPIGHRFDHSALGLYGDEGHVMYNFGGLQQSGTTNQMRPAHQFESSPSAGFNSHSAPFSEPGSRGHSIPPATPTISEHLRGYSVPHTTV